MVVVKVKFKGGTGIQNYWQYYVAGDIIGAITKAKENYDSILKIEVITHDAVFVEKEA